MPKFDTNTIDGFDAMTAEEKVTALLGVEIPEAVDLSAYVRKSVFDAKASEAANLSKQLKSKMSEDELAAAEKQRLQDENDQKYADLESKYNELVKRSTIAEYKAQYIAQGMDAKLAEDTAKALADGDMEKVFANQAKHNEALEKKIKADLMNKTPSPDGSGGDDGKKDSAVEKAREIAKAKTGNGSSYTDIMSKYKK